MLDFLRGKKKVEQKPVYVINGFLDSGKTSFIAYTIGQPYFQIKGTTLLILCEEGEDEYREGLLSQTNTVLEKIEDLEDFTTSHMMELEKKHRPERVIIEYNATWLMESLYAAEKPDSWALAQIIDLVDASTFELYLKNMRKYKYFKCPECHARLRLPRKVGEVTVTCGKCHHAFKQKA